MWIHHVEDMQKCEVSGSRQKNRKKKNHKSRVPIQISQIRKYNIIN